MTANLNFFGGGREKLEGLSMGKPSECAEPQKVPARRLASLACDIEFSPLERRGEKYLRYLPQYIWEHEYCKTLSQ